MVVITSVETYDLRWPTSDGMHGSDAVHSDPDYSCAYIVLKTDNADLSGHGLTFTIGRGTEVVKAAIEAYSHILVNQTLEHITSNFGAFWHSLVDDTQLRWLGPHKGVVHICCGAIVNAVWDLWAKHEKKPVWRLISDMEPEQIVSLIDFRWITDALTPEEALAILRAQQATKKDRVEKLMANGYPAYTTSAGWLGYTEEELREKCRAGVAAGWTHFKAKVGVNLQDDTERLRVIREEIGYDRTLMVDANQRWSVPEAIEYMKQLAQFKPWFIEEPTASDDILGHLAIKQALAPYNIKVATGEVCHNRVMFKQFIMSGALDICQIDSCRIAGVNEILSVLLIAAKYNVPVCPHAGGVGLCEYVQHLAMIDYIAISGKTQIIEYVNHLHEHFKYPVTVRNGCYFPPLEPGYSIEMVEKSINDYQFPYGKVWADRLQRNVSLSIATPMAKTHIKPSPTILSASGTANKRTGPTWLITGAQGFVGAWLIKALLADPSQPRVVCHDVQPNDNILSQVLGAEELSLIDRVYADICDADEMIKVVLAVKPQHICHLAGLQIPACRSNPTLGAKVNVGGTVNVFEACVQSAKAGFPVKSVVYASSAAVCGPAEDYGDDVVVPEQFNHQPRTQYGVFKLCNEANARIFALDHGIASVGLRPLTVFGVGRDVGMTSAPVRAIKNAIVNKTVFDIPFTGYTSFVDVRTVADLFIQSALKCESGATVCGIAGHRVSVEDFMHEAEAELPELHGKWKITPDAKPLPFPSRFDESNLMKLLGGYKMPPLNEGIRAMVTMFKELHAAGRLHGDDLQ